MISKLLSLSLVRKAVYKVEPYFSTDLLANFFSLFPAVVAGYCDFKASPFESGQKNDVKFWVILQNSISTLLSIVLACLALCETSWLMLSTISTGTCAVLDFSHSIFFGAVCVLGPKGWSSFQRLLTSFLRLR